MLMMMMRRGHVVPSCLCVVVLLCGLTASDAGSVYLNVPVTEVTYSRQSLCPEAQEYNNVITWRLAYRQTTGLCTADFAKPYTVSARNY